MSSATVFSLSDDALVSVFSFLSLPDLAKCSTVCRLWNTVFYDANLWQQRIVTEFAPDEVEEHRQRADQLADLDTYKALRATHLVHRFSQLPEHRNAETMVSSDGLSAAPNNGNWNFVLGHREIVLGRLFRAAVRIDRDSTSLTFSIGLFGGVPPEKDQRGYYGNKPEFWGTNEYFSILGASRARSSDLGQFMQPGYILGFELMPDATLSLYVNGYRLYTFPEPIDPKGKPLRLMVQLSGERLSATFVRFQKADDQEHIPRPLMAARRVYS
jgi:hypothetical protein